MNNGRPLSKRDRVRVLIAILLVIWATQTLLHQWGFGQDIQANQSVEAIPAERFVSTVAGGGTLELRSQATVYGVEVRLKQLCRWSDNEGAVFAPIGELVIARLTPQTPFKSITVQQIKSMLHDAGVNLASINFAGATSCQINRSDVAFDEGEALRKWVAAKDAGEVAKSEIRSSKSEGPSPLPSPGVPGEGVQKEAGSLRTALLNDLATRLNLPIEALQVDFSPKDEKLLVLASPIFRFGLEPRRVRNLGSVEWDVTITGPGGSQRAMIAASARAWQDQLVLAKPVSYRQIVRADDFIPKRALVDRLGDEPLLTGTQAVGQQASRDLKMGTVLTARMVDPVPLVRTGQLVAITLMQGNVQIKSVARSMDNGTFGQSIRVKSEATRDIFEVTVTGPQTAVMGTAPMVGQTFLSATGGHSPE